jgi:hypothetical protein
MKMHILKFLLILLGVSILAGVFIRESTGSSAAGIYVGITEAVAVTLLVIFLRNRK